MYTLIYYSNDALKNNYFVRFKKISTYLFGWCSLYKYTLFTTEISIIFADLRSIQNNRSTFTDDQSTSLSRINVSENDSELQIDFSPKASCTNGLTWLSFSYNIFVHIVLLSYTLYFTVISFYNESPYSIFCWHVPFMLLGVR